MQPGKYPKFIIDPKLKDRLFNAIRAGASYRAAAMAAGITETTIYIWKKHAREGKADYLEFIEEMKKVEAEAQVALLATIAIAAQGYQKTKIRTTVLPDGRTEREEVVEQQKHWQAAAWILERRWPDQYARRLQVGVNDDQQPNQGQIDNGEVAQGDVMGVLKKYNLVEMIVGGNSEDS